MPALVHFFTSGSVAQAWTSSLVTLWQLQTTAEPGSASGPSAAGAPAPAGGASCSAGTGGTVPVSGRSSPYASASPTRTPPSSSPPAPITSFLYVPERESA
ncbi:hypothetical protein SALBM135S_04668 [Streptomyces alboniger]